jgi:3'-5' exonuclease
MVAHPFGSYSSGAKVKLDEICKIIGLPGKPTGINGSQVEAMVEAGRIAEVAQYCESDVLNTYRLWLVYELFRGAVTPEQLDFSEAQAAEFIRTRKSDNPHLAASMDTAWAATMKLDHPGKPCFSALPEL